MFSADDERLLEAVPGANWLITCQQRQVVQAIVLLLLVTEDCAMWVYGCFLLCYLDVWTEVTFWQAATGWLH